MKKRIRALLDLTLTPISDPPRAELNRQLRRLSAKRTASVVDVAMRCRECGERKSLMEFYVHKHRSGTKHYDSYCNDCRKMRMVIRRTGVSLHQYRKMVSESAGRCAICWRPYKRPSIDHCHVTKQVRGVLCTACNSALGLFRDDCAVIKRALEYLTHYQKIGLTADISAR